MNMRLLTTPALALSTCIALAGSAYALESGSAIQPGTEFPAAPMSKGGISFSAPSNVLPPPGAAAPEPLPAPAPPPKKHRKHRKS